MRNFQLPRSLEPDEGYEITDPDGFVIGWAVDEGAVGMLAYLLDNFVASPGEAVLN